MSFNQGFTTITGETGAGKSILLGALSLVLGKRADLSSLKHKEAKCAIEAEFDIHPYYLTSFFEEKDLDYEDRTIVRREILPSGKSRAFINDTPVTLDVLSALGGRLVDIHSQHQTLQLTENEFQFRVVDALAENSELLADFKQSLAEFQAISKKLEDVLEQKEQSEKELDYNTFLLQELEKAPLQSGIVLQLEAEYSELDNVEQLIDVLSNAHQLLNDEQLGILQASGQLQQITQKLASFGQTYNALNDRIQSIGIELEDVAGEIEGMSETIEPNPVRLEEVNAQLQLLHNLFKKHQVGSVEELIEIREELTQKVNVSLNIDATIENLKNDLSEKRKELFKKGGVISTNRQNAIPKLKEQLEAIIADLGMQAASFKIEVHPKDNFNTNGIDDLVFQFSANKGSNYGELKKVASGGELSRIMLAIKAILASYENLPTLIFDEIDTGVSGEISNKMGYIMKNMGQSMQLFSITHLPQVASKGKYQFKVYKEESADSTSTHIRLLNDAQRIQELAEMLGGKSFSDAAMTHAKQLLAEGI